MDPIPVEHLAVWHHPSQQKKTRARFLLVHGLSEHSGRHLNTVTYLTQAGFEVVRFDLRGCGQSGGLRQWIDRFEDYTDDLRKVFNWTQSNLAPQPLFVLGHSLGGCIALYFAAVYGNALKGLILTSPAVKIGDATSPLKIALGKIVALAAPHFRFPRSPNQATLSRDPQVIADYLTDPLASPFNTVRQGKEILKAFDGVLAKAPEIHTPTLILHGSLDRVVRLEGSWDLLQVLGSERKTLHILPGGYHELHNDLDKVHFYELIQFWLDTIP